MQWAGIGSVKVFQSKEGIEGRSKDLDASEYRMSKIVNKLPLVSITIPKVKS